VCSEIFPRFENSLKSAWEKLRRAVLYGRATPRENFAPGAVAIAKFWTGRAVLPEFSASR
jgi:hypothetical protein